MPVVNPTPTTITNAYVVDVRELTVGEATAKELTLPSIPTDPTKVTLDLIGGTSQQIGLDFNVVGDVLTWDGFALETNLDTGDKLRIIYPL